MTRPPLSDLTIVSQYYYPEQASTALLLHGIARKLVERGVAVRAITTHPTYFGAQKMEPRVIADGVEIERVKSYLGDKNRIVNRVMRDLTFLAASTLRLLADDRKGPVLFVTCPPEGPWIGRAVHALRSRPYYLLIYDLYPELAETVGVLPPNHPVGQAWRAVNRSVFGRADGIITLGPYAASYIRDHYLPESQWGKVHVVPNWAGGGDLRPVPKETNPFALEHGLTDKFVLLMSGNLGRFQEFDSLLKAARLLEGTNVLFLFIGEGGAKPDLIDAARRQPNVRVMDFVPEALFPYSLGSADLMLVTLKPGAERAVVPCRTYSYLASGRAILAVMRAHADTAQELTRFDCGEVVDYDPARIAERVLWLRDHPERVRELGANARKAFEEHFTLDKISDLYYRLLASPRTPEASS